MFAVKVDDDRRVTVYELCPEMSTYQNILVPQGYQYFVNSSDFYDADMVSDFLRDPRSYKIDENGLIWKDYFNTM